MTLRASITRLLFGALIVGAALWLALNRDRLDPALIESSIGALGAWAPVGYIVVYALATVLFVPGLIFGLAGGALFGPVWGTLINLIGATLGATAAFLASRYLIADWVRGKVGQRLERLIAGVEAEGWRFVAITRLVPLVPFNLLNYALGLTRIPLAQYVIASLLFMAPGTLAYTWLGYAGREALAGEKAAIRYGLIALAVLAIIAFLPRLVRRIRSEPEKPRWIETDELSGRIADDKLAVIDVRGPDEFTGPLGHIAGALNLPIDELPKRLDGLAAHKDKQIVLVCRTDKRSANGAAILGKSGFRDVWVLRGGMEQWQKSGLPVESER